MVGETDSGTAGTVRRHLHAVVWGRTDTRVRATWRVLLAMPLLWIVTGGILTGNVQSGLDVIPSGGAPGGGLAQSLLHAGFFALGLAVWARYLDRQPLTNYGISASWRWVLDLLAGFVAILLGFGFWIGVGAVLGEVTVEVSPSPPDGSIVFGLVLPFVALVLHAAVQQVVFFRVILEAAAEGLHSRGLGVVRAAVAAVPVAVLFFVLMHGEMSVLRGIDLVVAGTIFAVLYLQTGQLGTGIGAHFGSLYGGIVLSAVVQTTGSLPGALGVVNQYGFPKVVVAYLVLLGWLKWRDRDITVRSQIASWTCGPA